MEMINMMPRSLTLGVSNLKWNIYIYIYNDGQEGINIITVGVCHHSIQQSLAIISRQKEGQELLCEHYHTDFQNISNIHNIKLAMSSKK